MNQSILNEIKKMLGISEEYEHFNPDIIVGINSAISILHQLGVGPDESFVITGANETWGDYLGDTSKLEFVKQFVYLQTRLVFDPPTNSNVTNSYEKLLEELKWRINVDVD